MSAYSTVSSYDPREAAGCFPLPREADSLLSAHRGSIYAFLRRKGFNAEEADDLTQETLIRAYLHLGGFRGSSMGGWLYRIAANVSVDFLRRQRLSLAPLDSYTHLPGGEEDPVAGLDRAEQRDVMLALIGELPECHQRILHLRYYEDRSLAEIAGVMNCSPSAAKLRVFRAVSALRRRCRQSPPVGLTAA